jgi:ubiquinone/menaquinone biosynthesis C-methylase UbiE
MNEKYAQKLLKENIETYGEIAEHFDQTRQWIPPEHEKLRKYIHSGDSVLDLGCGNGRFYETVKKVKNTSYTGIDASQKLVEIARKNYPQASFQKASGLDLPFDEGSFDKVFVIATFHHIPSQKLRHKFLKEARKVLKKDGMLLVTVWNLWQKKYLPLIFNFTIKKILGKTKLDFKDILKPWGKGEQKRYYHAFTRGELRKNLKKNGFNPTKIKYLKRNDKKANILACGEK